MRVLTPTENHRLNELIVSAARGDPHGRHSLVPERIDRVAGHQNRRLLNDGADAARDANALARVLSSSDPRRARRDSSRRAAGPFGLDRTARRIQHAGSKPRRPGHIFCRVVPDDEIFVYRNARNAARPAQQIECDRTS